MEQAQPLPILVQNDPWLEPQTEAIRDRTARFESALEDIRKNHGSLSAYSTAHKYCGIHFDKIADRWTVREWLPEARAVSLIGDFNQWNRDSHPLEKKANGIWETTLPAGTLSHEAKIKLHIHGADDSRRDRLPATIQRAVQDPETHDYTAQIWSPPQPYVWQHQFDPQTVGAPLIYEAHTGMAGEEPRVHTYREFAENTLPRIQKAGYNTIQLMAVQEHPYYGSFGYHVSSFFAACSRYGTPEDLKFLVDTAHGMGIAIILDIVHSHAVKNLSEGLNNLDGSGHQYFHGGEKGDHPQWDSKCFDYSRPEVKQFLLSNVRYWLEEFRFDGFRFDGITSMLYHSHGNRAFGSYEDYYGDDVDHEAITYLKLANQLISEIKPGAIVVAEDMSGMPGLCRPNSEGGVGFTHRLAMGIPDHWIKLLKHQRDEEWDLDELWGTITNRRHGEATIAYAESHDQALVGDKTLAFRLMDKEMYFHMKVDDPHPVIERGIALHKIIRLLTLAFGGEGWLNFMGNEFGHPEWLDFPREGNDWSYHYCRRQWSLVDNPDLKYKLLAEWDRDLVLLAREKNLLSAPPAQLLHVDHENKILIAERANLIFVINLSPDKSIPGYGVHPNLQETHKLLLDSDQSKYGGHNRLDPSVDYPIAPDGQLKFYTTSRSAIVLGV
ncbi:alpha-amylase family glycosyl hydrolase [Luteolibacter sp. AS25]|uniref:alpha-amylase family glycosyl hydrolase n=1 Tax=Luteolibacter sp. AS25 TaxID=3135776 RepID=UPI00398A7E5C